HQFLADRSARTDVRLERLRKTVAKDHAGDAFHEVEGRADHGGVLAEQQRTGRPNGRVAERGEDAELARHVVRGGEERSSWGPAEDPVLVAGLDEEGFVGMARHVTIGGELAGELVGERGAQVFGQAGYVNEGFEL